LRNPPTVPTFVARTGYGQAADVERCGAAGFDHPLVKPIDPERLESLRNGTVPATPD